MSLWAKRRAAVAAEAQAEAEARRAAVRQAEEQALAERTDAELLAEAGVKDPDALVSAEEVRAFLKHALPERLKRRALRRLWGLNPVLANVDGLVDYGEDFTDKAVCVENMQTLYTVGKGMLEQFKGLEAEPEDVAGEDEAVASRTCSGTSAFEADEEAPDQVRGAEIDETEDDADQEVPGQVRDGGVSEPAPVVLDEPDAVALNQRRMRFTFEGV
ncbi:DUF3306 domain-containing protein [Marinovum sp.]|uniref:DUF3306 domain-containing protein n=1 Tax=Marinovum sp. TaxID=2024839 RepID=UPI002B26C22E|nr:DUF3306 domain-containing protein [Marinovum sp.]